MDAISVRTADIGAMAAQFGADADAIEQQVHELVDAAALMLNGWEGEAAEAFRVRFTQAKAELLIAQEALRAAQKLALALEDTYARADVTLANLFE